MQQRSGGGCVLVLFLFVTLSTPPGSAAQILPDPYLRRHWTTSEGLPQNSVTAIVQTRDGYLWLATHAGLVRFDGIRFTVFTATSTPALADNRILALFEDAAGTLWIATETGLAQFVNGAFQPASIEQELPNARVRGLSGSRDGGLWIAWSGGLAHVREGRVTTPVPAQALPHPDVLAVHEGRDGTVWVGTRAGLARIRSGQIMRTTAADGLPHDTVTALAETEDGTIWAATPAGLAELRGSAFGSMRVARTRPLGATTSLLADQDGTVWAGTAAGVVRITRGQEEQFVRPQLPDSAVLALAQDRQGGVWIGTAGGGVSQWRRRPVEAVIVGDPAATITSVYEDRAGTIWFGAECGGLHSLPAGQFGRYAAVDALASDCVSSLAGDRSGTLWVGTANGVVQIRETRVTRFGETQGLPNPRVRALFVDLDNVLWVGTAAGLSRFDGLRFTTLTRTDGLVHDDVRLIAQDEAGALWIGTSHGVSVYASGQFTNYTAEDGLPGLVRAVHADREGAVWIGTHGGGLVRFKDGAFVQITTDQGLPDNVVARILEDAGGDLWMAGNRGIVRVPRRDLHDVADGRLARVTAVTYDEGDGMPGSQAADGGQPGGWLSRDGRVWFGTTAGLAMIDPARAARVAPAVHIERLIVDGEAQAGAEMMQIPAGAHGVAIDYTGTGLLAPEKVLFRYMLEGYDRDWIDAGTRRTAYYARLPPGRYSFRVIARSSDGAWNRTGAAVSIRQRAHFYQLPVFWGFLVVAAALGIVRVHRLRVRHLVRRIAELGAGVAERTVQLRERGDRLAAAAGELSAAQERIDRANQAMLASFDQLRPGIVVAAGDGTVVFASQSAKRLLQLDDSACGRPWTAALPFDDEHRAELLRQVERPAAERQAVYAVYRLESGRRLAIEVEVVDDPRDATARIFCFYDVSDLHELRERTDRAPAPNPPAIAAPPAELHEGNGHGESRLLPEIGPGDERQRVIEALQRAGGNRAEAARLLGIARSTFYRRLKALGLEVQPT